MTKNSISAMRWVRLAAAYLAIGWAGLTPAQAGTTFANSNGFSGVQGSNGWSYAVVHFPDAGDLYHKQSLLNYDAANNWWTLSGTSVRITTNQQSKAAGNAYFSLRYWTADKTYENVSVKSTWYPAADDSAAVEIVFYDASAGTQSSLASAWSPAGGSPINISAFLPRVDAGDRIYFKMSNSGQADDNYDRLHQWDQEIAVNAFNNNAGFSGIQGANGWSYACVHFPYEDISDLYHKQIMLSYASAQATWGIYGLGITRTAQSKIEGNAYFSLRYWTADKSYVNVAVQSLWYSATNDVAGVRVVYYKASSGVQSTLVDTLFDNADDTPRALNASLPRVDAGDRIYFLMQNSGVPGAPSGVLQRWDQTIWATRFIPEGTVFSVR